MYNVFRNTCERVLRIPPDPEIPPGDEHSTRFFRAAPNFYRYLFFIWLAGTVVLSVLSLFVVAGPIAVAVIESRKGHPAALLFLIIPGLIFLVFGTERLLRLAAVRLDFEKRWYIVTDRSLRIREGIFNVREITITFANIQNISISQGPIQRALGLADLRVDTAGGGPVDPKHGGLDLHTARFRGIDNAPFVRELINTRLKAIRGSGLGDHDDRHTPAAQVPNNPSLTTALRQVLVEAQALNRSLQARSKPLTEPG